jgi:protein arginine N-methyltransferase 3
VFPDQATVYLTAIDSGERLDYWDDVYGFRMSCMKVAVRTEAAVEVVDPWAVMATTSLVYVCACDVHGRRGYI